MARLHNSDGCRPPQLNFFCVKNFGAPPNHLSLRSQVATQPIIVLRSLVVRIGPLKVLTLARRHLRSRNPDHSPGATECSRSSKIIYNGKVN